jgi:hypothetical protein
MRVKTTVKAGQKTQWPSAQRSNGALVRVPSLKVQTGIKAGALAPNHSEALVRAGGLKVQTGIKAGVVTNGTLTVGTPT